MTEWVKVYDLTWDEEHLAGLAKASAEPGPWGIDPSPAPAGSQEWLAALERGELASGAAQGLIVNVFWGSMADWPSFTMVDDNGVESTWTRKGDPRRYVAGLAVEVDWVEVAHKPGSGVGQSRMVLQVRLEKSAERSSAIAPGPERVGYRIAGGPGAVVHYLQCDEPTVGLLEEALVGRVFKVGTPRPAVNVRVQGGVPEDLRALASAVGASYDGYEVIQADGPPLVYGPSSF